MLQVQIEGCKEYICKYIYKFVLEDRGLVSQHPHFGVLLEGNRGHFGVKPGGEGESLPELDTKGFVCLPSPALAAGSW